MKVQGDFFGVSRGRKFFEKTIWLLIAIGSIIGVFFLMDKYIKDRTETIAVVYVSGNEILQNSEITEMNIQSYDLIKKEYNPETMFLWSEKDTLIGKYATYYLKEETPVYKDATYGEKRYRNEWMYGIEEGKEVLTIPFDYKLAGGNILVPGDKIRIRVVYATETTSTNNILESTTNNPDVDFEGLFDQPGASNEMVGQKDTFKVDTLFKEIEVIDMLSNGESIYEKYIELKYMAADKRQLKLKDENFAKTIIPDAFVILVDEADAYRYLQAEALESVYLITILPREKNETILDRVELIEDLNEEILNVQ